jgi:hypothetical protein
VALSQIVQAAPDDLESGKTIPLLLAGMVASNTWKSLAIRALEPMRSMLPPASPLSWRTISRLSSVKLRSLWA